MHMSNPRKVQHTPFDDGGGVRSILSRCNGERDSKGQLDDDEKSFNDKANCERGIPTVSLGKTDIFQAEEESTQNVTSTFSKSQPYINPI